MCIVCIKPITVDRKEDNQLFKDASKRDTYRQKCTRSSIFVHKFSNRKNSRSEYSSHLLNTIDVQRGNINFTCHRPRLLHRHHRIRNSSPRPYWYPEL